MSKFRFKAGSTAAQLGLLAAMTVASPAALAAIVCATTPVSIPNNINGIYVNLVTNATGTGGAATAGWDFSAYGPSSGNLTFYLPPNGAVVGTSVTASVVAAGTAIGPASTYTTTSTTANSIITPTAFRVGGTFMTGIRFLNEATSTVNYGWAELTTVGPGGFPATINRYCYENSGAAINAYVAPWFDRRRPAALPARAIASTRDRTSAWRSGLAAGRPRSSSD